jgi:23S rRNA pseudouridine1911/1915/1917 synthase
MEQVFTSGPKDEGERLDHWLSQKAGVSRSQVVRAIEAGKVLLNGKPLKKNFRLEPGQEISFDSLPPEPLDAGPENIPLDIIFEDKDIILINKPAGLVVHPAVGNRTGTLVNALLGHFPELADSPEKIRPGLVHRLDKDTSGIMVVAKNLAAQEDLAGQIRDRKVTKIYKAVVGGLFKKPEGEVDRPIGRNTRRRKQMTVIEDPGAKSREARTLYRVLEEFKGASLVELRPVTGRTHQIRVHLDHLGHPVLGDEVYGRRKTRLILRQALHAEKLSFTHPKSGKKMEFTAPLPPDMLELLKALRAGKSV